MKHTDSLPAAAKHISGRCIKAASDLSCARAWLNDCLNNHDHGPKEAATRPSRLVAVGTVDGSKPIKIIDDSNPGDKYLALSYCWGRSSDTLRTTAETLDTFHTSIPWDCLPKTFQDAIHIARDFGTGYIWIDSLCIVQDSKDDWDAESAKMADIYNGALFTVMAASASHSHGGCFQDRIAAKETVALPYTDASGKTELSVFVSRTLPGYEEVVLRGPLFKRGWVFQERLMSKRKLIFGHDQTYWECNTVFLSESNIQSRDIFAHLHRHRIDALRAFPDPLYEDSIRVLDPEESLARLWVDLVCEYSLCTLTYDTDRLPSLSGLARTFATKSGGAYAAGLWQDQMPYSLAYYVSNRPRETCKRNYCAPSWSWASTLGQISFFSEEWDLGNFELEVLSIDIKLAGRDPYGRVKPGSSMCVRGRLCAGVLVSFEGYDECVFLETEDGCRRGKAWLDERGDGKDLPADITCLEVSTILYGSGVCLLLQRTEKDGQFQRIGMVELDDLSQDEDYLFYGLEKQVIVLV